MAIPRSKHAHAGIAPGDVKTMDLRSEEMAATPLAGRADAVATWEPWLSGASKAAGENGVAISPEAGFTFGFHLAGRREFVRDHPATMQKMPRALLRAERYLEEQPPAARAILVEATKSDPVLFDIEWSSFNLRLTLRQGLLTMLEDQARWAISGGYTEAAAVPDFLETIYLDAMLAVKPKAVSNVR